MAAAERQELLTAEQLLEPLPAVEPVANQFFAPPSEEHSQPSAPQGPRFVGSLRLPSHRMHTTPSAVEPADIGGKHTQLFPCVTTHWVSYADGHLVPVERGGLLDDEVGRSYWQFQPERGRVWHEAGDGALWRAAFPFILTSRIENESYYGLATFLFNEDGVASCLRYQVVQQLANFLVETRFVAAGQLRVDCDASSSSHDTPAFRARLERELAEELPWRDWSELEQQFGAEALSGIDSGSEPSAVVASGLLLDGTVYTRPFPTPYGPFPFPRQMRHGVWSCTKSLIGLVMAARLAQLYGAEVLDYRIRDYVDLSRAEVRQRREFFPSIPS